MIKRKYAKDPALKDSTVRSHRTQTYNYVYRTDKGGHTGHVTIALTNVRWLSERFAHVTRWVGDTTVAKMAPLQLPASIQHSPHTCPQ